jgi:hypothetical protein
MAKSLTQHKPLLPAISGGLNKSQISILVQKSVETVMERGNILQMAEVVSVMEEFIKGFRKDERFIDYLREELIKNQGAIITKAGAKIEVCEVGVVYDYSSDAGWRELDRQIKELECKRKVVEDRLRRIPPGKTIVDGETGEVFTGPAKSSKSSYKVTLSKR